MADTFDALTSARLYRPAMPITQAEVELERVAGYQLDPRCVEVFVQLLRSGKVSLKSGPDGVREAASPTSPAETSAALR